MPNPPFMVLEGLFSPESARPEFVKLGRQIVENDRQMKAYSQRQCELADRALQGGYSVGAILLLDRTRITSLSQLWQYRQFMALISNYKPAQKKSAWVEAEEPDERLVNDFRQSAPPHLSIDGIILAQPAPKSPLELCSEIRFGYRKGMPDKELVGAVKKIISQDRENAAEILNIEYENARKTNARYTAFLQEWYAEFLHNDPPEQDAPF